MEVQNQSKADWSQRFCNQPPAEFDPSGNSLLLCNELESSSDSSCSIWTNAEQAGVQSYNNRSFAMDARIRLDSLKSGCNSPSPCRATDGKLFNYNCEKDLWDSEESQDEESALDSVELIDVEEDEQDEESCIPYRLYESSKKQLFVERSDSALRWCRHVLDNPSPETEAACRSLINRLDQRSSCHFYRSPAAFHQSLGSSADKTSTSTTHKTSDSSDNNDLNISYDSITSSYRLEDITDVHIMARIQEASLRQDYVSTPACRNSGSPGAFPSEAPPSFWWQAGVTPLSSSARQAAGKQSCNSPKLARLHQQVTQFKLLKLAQNQAASPGRTRSPLRTSLRSLQAVRNSRSLDTEDWQPAEQSSYPPTGASSVPKGSSWWSPPSRPAAAVPSDRTTAVKRLLRSQSLSPCRIPQRAKGYLSANGRVFASAERSTTVAWGRNVQPQR
ncbi:SLAIN motif-containing protein-like [Centropristis striata]|uniref:SLAIN motif-containing protein-like n=1 Tax=Centropristis striata TaxID=184440 RepID=UPI0027DEDD39|nr:SLAIN motif-containing protein-like [Centropristis striata]